jgi:hypothetical protein
VAGIVWDDENIIIFDWSFLEKVDKEYLPTLSIENLNIGDLVLVKDINTARGNWLMSMITQCYPGIDGIVRVVEVKTMYGEYKRPVVKLMKIDVTKLGMEPSLNTIGEKNVPSIQHMKNKL